MNIILRAETKPLPPLWFLCHHT